MPHYAIIVFNEAEGQVSNPRFSRNSIDSGVDLVNRHATGSLRVFDSEVPRECQPLSRPRLSCGPCIDVAILNALVGRWFSEPRRISIHQHGKWIDYYVLIRAMHRRSVFRNFRPLLVTRPCRCLRLHVLIAHVYKYLGTQPDAIFPSLLVSSTKNTLHRIALDHLGQDATPHPRRHPLPHRLWRCADDKHGTAGDDNRLP